MTLGIGIDSVDIIRFSHWHTYSRAILLRVFSDHDLNYCVQNPTLSAERFASRFAAREALYKALGSYIQAPLPLLTLCKAVEIHTTPSGAPQLLLDWSKFPNVTPTTSLISITHTTTTATAIVMLQATITTKPPVQIE